MNKKTRFLFVSICFFLSMNSYAEWVSEVDLEYAKSSPKLYDSLLQAKVIINSSNKKKYKEAYVLLNNIIDSDDQFIPAYVQYSRLMSRVGNPRNNVYSSDQLAEQEKALNKALNIEPNYDYALVMMGFTKMFQGKLEEAQQSYDLAVKLDSKYPYLKSQLAQLAFRRGDYNRAIEINTKGYEQYKGNPKIAPSYITEFIIIYEKLGRAYLDKLEYWHLKRIDSDSNNAWSFGDYARIRLYERGDYETAITYYNRALSIKNYGRARYQLAIAHYLKWASLSDDLSKREEANQSWITAKELYSDTEEILDSMMKFATLKPAGAKLAAAVKRDTF